MIVFLRAGRVTETSAEAGVRTPVGETVASSEVVDRQWRTSWDFEVGKLS